MKDLAGVLLLAFWFCGICSLISAVVIFRIRHSFVDPIGLFLSLSAFLFAMILTMVALNAIDQQIKHEELDRGYTIEEFEQEHQVLGSDTKAILRLDDAIYIFNIALLSGYVVTRNMKITRIRYITSSRLA